MWFLFNFTYRHDVVHFPLINLSGIILVINIKSPSKKQSLTSALNEINIMVKLPTLAFGLLFLLTTTLVLDEIL